MNRIRELRKQMSMTQKELAKYLNVADSTLSYWEIGKYEPGTEALMKLSRFFKVPIDYILGGDFPKWDIDASNKQYPEFNSQHLIDSDISVSEARSAYSTNDKNMSFVEPAAVNSPLCKSAGSSIPDIIKPVTPSNTAAYGLRNAQAAFERIEFENMTQEEIDLLAEYAVFIKSRRKNNRMMPHRE